MIQYFDWRGHSEIVEFFGKKNSFFYFWQSKNWKWALHTWDTSLLDKQKK